MNRRDRIRMSEDEMRSFLDGRHTMNVATMNHDGTIHLVAMWYGFLSADDVGPEFQDITGKPVFWTYQRSQKVLNLERNPQVTCLVEAGEAYEELQGVELVGKARILRGHDERMAIGRVVFERYIGPWSEEARPYVEQTGAKRVGVVIDADRAVTWDHRKLDGAY